MFIIILILSISLIVILEAFCLVHYRLRVNHSSFKSTKLNDHTSLKVLLLSDLHFRKHTPQKLLDQIIEVTHQEKPDLICFTGDLLNKNMVHKMNDNDHRKLHLFLSSLEATYAKLAVYGNHDYEDSTTTKSVEGHLNKANFTILRNQSLTINTNSNSINCIGLDSEDDGTLLIEPSFATIDPKQLNIVLEHTPDTFDKINTYPFDIMLAGHSHGGQVRLPIIGAIIHNHYAKQYDLGHYHQNGHHLLVTSGLGTTGIHVRLFNPPAIEIINFVHKKDRV